MPAFRIRYNNNFGSFGGSSGQVSSNIVSRNVKDRSIEHFLSAKGIKIDSDGTINTKGINCEKVSAVNANFKESLSEKCIVKNNLTTQGSIKMNKSDPINKLDISIPVNVFDSGVQNIAYVSKNSEIFKDNKKQKENEKSETKNSTENNESKSQIDTSNALNKFTKKINNTLEELTKRINTLQQQLDKNTQFILNNPSNNNNQSSTGNIPKYNFYNILENNKILILYGICDMYNYTYPPTSFSLNTNNENFDSLWKKKKSFSMYISIYWNNLINNGSVNILLDEQINNKWQRNKCHGYISNNEITVNESNKQAVIQINDNKINMIRNRSIQNGSNQSEEVNTIYVANDLTIIKTVKERNNVIYM